MRNTKFLIVVSCLIVFAMAGTAEAVDWSKGGTELFPSKYTYPTINKNAVDNWWFAQHASLEKAYIASGPYAGAWKPSPINHPTVTHPDTREVGEIILGYIYAYRAFKTEDPTKAALYKTRAIGGLDYLLREQIRDGSEYHGSFRYYYEAPYGTGVSHGQPFEPGRGGLALIEGYQEFKDPRYLEAAESTGNYFSSKVVLDYYKANGISNKPSFGARLLAELYNVTGKSLYMDKSVEIALMYTSRFGYEGYYTSNHDKIMYYHMMMIGNLIEIFKYLPASNPNHARLSDVMYRGLNHIILHQRADGAAELFGDPATDGATLTTNPNPEDFVIRALATSKSKFGPMAENVINGLENYDLTLPVGWQEGYPANSGYMTWYVRGGGTSSLYTSTSPASSCTKFVAKNGNDANPGTEASPWLTIQKAANMAKAGDTICVKAGTYTEEVNFPNSGTAGNYITFQNYGTDVVTIKPPIKTYHTYSSVTPNHHPGNFEIVGKSYIKIKGFMFTNNGYLFSNVPYYSVVLEYNTHHIIIDGNRFLDVPHNAAVAAGYFKSSTYGAWNIDVINNRITNNDKTETSAEEAISFSFVNYGNVSNNIVDTHNGIAIDFKEGTTNGIISYNIISNVVWMSSGNAWTGYLGPAIYVDAFKYGVSDISVFNNIARNSDYIGIGSECGGLVKNISFYNNIMIGSYQGYSLPTWCNPSSKFSCTCSANRWQDVSFINNVAYNANGFFFRVQVGQSNVIIRNNIGYGTGKNSIPSGVTQDHNSWNLGITDPQFVNPSANDFHLKSTSPAIDKGASAGAPSIDFDGNKRPAGAGYDLGTYEYCTGASCITPNPNPTCTDGIQNQGETGVDCGGPCPACTSNLAPTSITLKPGWNQISSPLASGIDVSAIEAAGCVILPYKNQKLWAWSAQTQTWINPAKVEPFKGYWIYAAYQCTVPLSGTPATFTNLPLTAGWNKISAQGTFLAIQGTCANHITGNWVWNWDKTTEKWIHPTTMQLDKGYWIKVDQNCVLGS